MIVVPLLLGYLLGAIPFGVLLTRRAGIGDLRLIGSGNIGATNVLRTGRRDLAVATLLLDAGKGAAAVLLASRWLGPEAAMIAGLGAVLGHLFPIWLSFKGGKGVATGLGVLVAAACPVGLASAAIWLLVVAITRISSAGALAAFAGAPALAAWLAGGPTVLLALAVGILIYIRHEPNIRRLLAGTEPRIERRR